MQDPNEYEVYPRGYTSAMSEEEEETTTEETGNEERAEEENPVAGFRLDGYTTLFDTKVSLTPVELVPGIKK